MYASVYVYTCREIFTCQSRRGPRQQKGPAEEIAGCLIGASGGRGAEKSARNARTKRLHQIEDVCVSFSPPAGPKWTRCRRKSRSHMSGLGPVRCAPGYDLGVRCWGQALGFEV